MTSSNENISALLVFFAGNSPVTGEFPSQRPVTRSFDVVFHLGLNIRLSKHSWVGWFETPSRSLWRHYNVWTKSLTKELHFLFLMQFSLKFVLACYHWALAKHYSDVIMRVTAFQITGISSVYSTVYKGADKGNIKAPCDCMAFTRGIHRWPMNSPHQIVIWNNAW